MFLIFLNSLVVTPPDLQQGQCGLWIWHSEFCYCPVLKFWSNWSVWLGPDPWTLNTEVWCSFVTLISVYRLYDVKIHNTIILTVRALKIWKLTRVRYISAPGIRYLNPGAVILMMMMVAWMLIGLLCSVCTVFVNIAFSSNRHTDIWSNVMMINVWIFSARPTFLNLNLNLNSLRLQPAGPKRRFFSSLFASCLHSFCLSCYVCVSILISFCHSWSHIMSPSLSVNLK